MKENLGEDLTEPSEYELLRQRNIEKRKSLFQELNLNQVGNVVIWMVHYAIMTRIYRFEGAEYSYDKSFLSCFS